MPAGLRCGSASQAARVRGSWQPRAGCHLGRHQVVVLVMRVPTCTPPQMGSCIRGERCPYAHNVFEYWLHPTRWEWAGWPRACAHPLPQRGQVPRCLTS